MKILEHAVRFDQESVTVRVKYWSSIEQIDGIELRTVLEAMDVSFVSLLSLLLATFVRDFPDLQFLEFDQPSLLS